MLRETERGRTHVFPADLWRVSPEKQQQVLKEKPNVTVKVPEVL